MTDDKVETLAKDAYDQKEPKDKSETKLKEAKISEYDELKDRMLRLAAEFDNYKRRVKADIENAKTVGKAEMLKDILPVLDEFELAFSAVGKSSEENFSKGFELVYSNFKDCLKKEGLDEIDTDGVYDPYKHDILMTKTSDKKDGTILQTVKKGYMFNGMLLRPAAVIISSGNVDGNKESDKDENKN